MNSTIAIPTTANLAPLTAKVAMMLNIVSIAWRSIT
jgi:hypothetical protein